MFELGTFILFNIIGFGCMIFGLVSNSILAKPLALLSILALMFLAFSLLQPQNIGISTNETSTITDGTTTWTENKNHDDVYIGNNLTRILPWIYFGFSFIPVYFLARTNFGTGAGK